MIVNETIIVPLGDIDKTKKVGVVITAETLPVFGRIFVHEGFEVLKVETDFTGIIKLFTSENMNRPEVSYDVKVVPTGYKIDPLDEYIDTLKLYHPGGDTAAHIFIQHAHPPRGEKF